MSGVTAAQSCAGFTDVSSGSSFCPNVEWLKNRGITLGCSSTTLYCPSDGVTRLAMAAFMNRLGNVLTPQLLGTQLGVDTPTVLPLEGDPAVIGCATALVAAADYPRKAVVTAMLSGLSNAARASFRAFLVVNPNNGGYQTFVPGSSAAARATLAPTSWGTVTVSEIISLEPATTYRFAVALRQENLLVEGGTLDRYRCQLTAAIFSRTGSVSPF
jgi:hypothetical protein